jgi:hypothetical protein
VKDDEIDMMSLGRGIWRPKMSPFSPFCHLGCWGLMGDVVPKVV